jgi:hypothetical protein
MTYDLLKLTHIIGAILIGAGEPRLFVVRPSRFFLPRRIESSAENRSIKKVWRLMSWMSWTEYASHASKTARR